MREVACVGSARTLLVADVGDVLRPCVTLAAGTHGDEPAAPWALLNILESGLLHSAFSYRVWPCINPTGFQSGRRVNVEGTDVNRSFSGGGSSPEAKAIITADRDRRFVASFDLHEDVEAQGFYCFEVARENETTLGDSVVDVLREGGFPLQQFPPGFDLGYGDGLVPDARVECGRVRLALESELKYFQPRGLPFTAYMVKRAAHFGLTFETPATRSWQDRVSMHRVAVQRALSQLAKVTLARPTN